MKKRIMILLMVITVLLSGCFAKKDTVEPKVIEVMTEQVVEVAIPKAEEVELPLIANVNYFGKDQWNESLVTETKIMDMADYANDFLYLSVFYRDGTPYTDSGSRHTRIIKLPNSAQKYLDEDSGIVIETDFTMCNKVLVNDGNTLLLAGASSTDSGMKLESYELTKGAFDWRIVGGTKTISAQDGNAYYEGSAEDIIVMSDQTYVFISNILDDEKGINKNMMTKVNKEGHEIWAKELPKGLFLTSIVEGSSADTVLVLAYTEEAKFSLIKVVKGEVIRTIELGFHADVIKKIDNGYFVLGTDHQDEVYNFTEMKFDTTSTVVKIDEDLNTIFTYTNANFNRFSDCLSLDQNTYLFVGNKGLDATLTAFFDTGKALLLIETDLYPGMGQPTQIIQREVDGSKEYIMTGFNLEVESGLTCTYSWIAHLYTLKPALDKLYKEVANKKSQTQFLVRGEQDRTDMAYAIGAYEGNNELMYIRYMKSDGLYSYVITGAWYNAQMIDQYLLEKELSGWKVVEKFATTDRTFEKIKSGYPGASEAILPPMEVADYVIKVLDDQQLKQFIEFVDASKLVGDISFCSYIGDYFYVMFKDGADYLIKQPEYATREVYQVKTYIPYNYYLINEDKPPFFLFIQN